MPRAHPKTSLIYACASLAMFVEAAYDGVSEEEWHDRWDVLAAGSQLREVVDPLLHWLDEQRRARVVKRFSCISDPTAAELADNSLVRLRTARDLGQVDPDRYLTTLHCPFFRLNVSCHEVDQLVKLYNGLYTAEFEFDSRDKTDAVLVDLLQRFSWEETHTVVHDLLHGLSEAAVNIGERHRWEEAPINLETSLSTALAVVQEDIGAPALEAVNVLVHISD